MGLLGENGAGKTTVIRMLVTTLLPTSGEARVGGFDVVREPRRVREIIGLVSSDERSFYWRLTGRQNLAFFAALYHLPAGVASRRIDELLEIVGVAGEADRPFHLYSTGTRHRFSIARGLLTDPEVLFLDEPTRSLDPVAADEVRALVRERIVRQMGRTALMATHSLTEAEEICDRVAIIRSGRLVAAGTVAQLRRQFGLATTCEIAIDGGVDIDPAAIAGLRGVLDAMVVADGSSTRLELMFERGGAPLDLVLRELHRAGVVVRGCATREPTLEEVYRLALGADGRVVDPMFAAEQPA
jgi:ABC-2 type transport system ATP-binding protein